MKKLGFARYSLMVGLTLFVASGCAGRRELLKTPVVSMTQDSLPANRSAQNLGPVSVTYCPGDPHSRPDEHDVGLMDEVTLKGQNEKNASYIGDAQFFMDGHNCIILEGVAFK